MEEITYLFATDPGPAENPVPKPGPELPENPPPTIPPVEQPNPTGPQPADPGSLPPRAGRARYIWPGLHKSFTLKAAGDFFPQFRLSVCNINYLLRMWIYQNHFAFNNVSLQPYHKRKSRAL